MRVILNTVRLVIAAFLLISAGWPAVAADTPRLAGRVTDLAQVLSADENAALTALLARYEKETTHQLAVLTIPTLSGESIDAYAMRVANTWGLGRKGVDNGMLVVLAMAERQVRIQLGYGFERYISNAQASQIIQTLMVPSFRRSEYAKGLDQGLEELMRQGRALVAPPRTPL